jgi:hypothetical protein
MCPCLANSVPSSSARSKSNLSVGSASALARGGYCETLAGAPQRILLQNTRFQLYIASSAHGSTSAAGDVEVLLNGVIARLYTLLGYIYTDWLLHIIRRTHNLAREKPTL